MANTPLFINTLSIIQHNAASVLANTPLQQAQQAADPDRYFWLFSTTAQVLAAVVMISVTAAIFALEHESRRQEQDTTAAEEIERKKARITNSLRFLVGIFLIAIPVNLVLTYYAPYLASDYNNQFVWFVYVTLLTITFILIAMSLSAYLPPKQSQVNAETAQHEQKRSFPDKICHRIRTVWENRIYLISIAIVVVIVVGIEWNHSRSNTQNALPHSTAAPDTAAPDTAAPVAPAPADTAATPDTTAIAAPQDATRSTASPRVTLDFEHHSPEATLHLTYSAPDTEK